MPTFNDVASVELRQQELTQRMDRDKNLYYLSKYVMRDDLGEPVSGVINITLNLPATFAAHVHASLMGAVQQVKVTGKNPDGTDMDEEKAKEIEDFLEFAVESADMRLRKRGESTLRPFFTEQVDIRGRGGFRCTVRMQDGDVLIDVLPLDTRYFFYEMGVNGMIWGAYKTWRSPAMIKSEYPGFLIDKLATQSLTPAGGAGTLELLEVTDMWDEETNTVFVGGKEAKSVSHSYKEPPMGVEIVPMGSMLQDQDKISHRGESIFFLVRDLVPEINRLATILQTQNMSTVKAALTWHGEEGPQSEPPEDLGDLGTVTAADIKGGAKLVPQGDVGQAGQLLQTMLTRLHQQGSLSSTDFGNIPFPLSAVALVKLGESSGQVFLPRLGAKGLLFQQLAHMIIKQTLALNVDTVELGTPGHKRKFKTSILKGKYDIEYLYTVQSPETDVGRFAMAQTAAQWYGSPTILEDILKVENPAEIMRLKRLDDAELISPNVKRLRTVMALLAEAGQPVDPQKQFELEAEMLAEEVGISVEGLVEGEIPEPIGLTPDVANPNNLTPLANPATKAASNKLSSLAMGQPGGQEGRV